MQADEAEAFGKLAGEARAGTVSLVEELDQAVFTRSVATASPATRDDWRRRRVAVYVGVGGVCRGLSHVVGAGRARA
jgi:hypothetical protein